MSDNQRNFDRVLSFSGGSHHAMNASSCLFEHELNVEQLKQKALTLPYTFTMKIEDLISPTEYHRRRRNAIPRPKNGFILFRMDASARYRASGQKINGNSAAFDQTPVIRKEYRELATCVRNFFAQLAEAHQIAHHIRYPDYRYTPSRRHRSAGSRRNRDDEGDASTANAPTALTAFTTPTNSPIILTNPSLPASPATISLETPTDTPIETPVDTPIETPVDTPVETPVDTPVETPVDTPATSPIPANLPSPADTDVYCTSSPINETPDADTTMSLTTVDVCSPLDEVPAQAAIMSIGDSTQDHIEFAFVDASLSLDSELLFQAPLADIPLWNVDDMQPVVDNSESELEQLIVSFGDGLSTGGRI